MSGQSNPQQSSLKGRENEESDSGEREGLIFAKLLCVKHRDKYLTYIVLFNLVAEMCAIYYAKWKKYK